MRVIYTPFFKEKLGECSKEIRQKLYKQVSYLEHNLRYSSLRAKKYSEIENIWQARVNRSYRFYFLIEGDTYVLLDIKQHPK